MSLTFETVTGYRIDRVVSDLANLRVRVFRDWPYLYDGHMAYEQRYLSGYANAAAGVIVLARSEGRIVGAATGMALEDHADDFRDALPDYDPSEVFYCAESVLLPQYRGQGAGHKFFEVREAQARAMGRRYAMFCGVVRPGDHPARPVDYVPLDGFWRKRGYAPVAGAIAEFSWRDVGAKRATPKALQVWLKDLTA